MQLITEPWQGSLQKPFWNSLPLALCLGLGLPSFSFLPFKSSSPRSQSDLSKERYDSPPLHKPAKSPHCPCHRFPLRASCLRLLCCWKHTLLCLDWPLSRLATAPGRWTVPNGRYPQCRVQYKTSGKPRMCPAFNNFLPPCFSFRPHPLQVSLSLASYPFLFCLISLFVNLLFPGSTHFSIHQNLGESDCLKYPKCLVG